MINTMAINTTKLVPLGLCGVTPVFARIKQRMSGGYNIYFCIIDDRHILDIEDADSEFANWLVANSEIVLKVDSLKEELFNYMEKANNGRNKQS